MTPLTTFAEGFAIPEGIQSIAWLFTECKSLKALPADFTIPSSVTNMAAMFSGCSSLEILPAGFKIPSKVTSMNATFSNCTLLTGSITINTTPSEYSMCFAGCNMNNITITGSCGNIDELKATVN